MRTDTKTKKGMRALNAACVHSRRALEPFRQKRTKFVEQYVGYHYSASGAGKSVPVPIITQFIDIYRQELAARNPRGMVLTDNRMLKSEAASFELLLNDEIGRMQLGETIRDWITDALFCMGVMKVGIAEEGRIEIDGVERVFTMPYAMVVSLDDWVHDMTALSWADIDYEGNRYRLPLEDVEGNDLFDQDIVKKYAYATDVPSKDERGNKRVSAMATENLSHSDDEEVREYIDLWDIYFPQTGKFCTYIASGETDEKLFACDEPIRDEDWSGPAGGPFHKLRYKDVPDNTMPLSPIASIYDMHMMTNGLMRKVITQAMESKTVVGYQGSAADDAERLYRSKDLEMLRLDHPQDINTIRLSGLNQEALGLVSYGKSNAYEMAGNLSLLGGMGQAADTLGQDRMLMASASKMVQGLQSRTMAGVRDIIEDIAWYLWSDPNLDRVVQHDVFDTGVMVEDRIAADTVQGTFDSYRFDIVPYSMQERSPSQRLQSLLAFMDRLGFPMMQAGLLDQQGVTLNVAELMKLYGRYDQLDAEFKDVLQFADEDMVAQAAAEGQKRPAVTKRVNEYRSGGQTDKAFEQDFQKEMFSGGGDYETP